MEGSWDFLDPWHEALSARVYDPPLRPLAYSLFVSLITPQQPISDRRLPSQHRIAVDIPVDEASRRNLGELKLLREALELFTVLFRVNYNKFGEILAQRLPGKALNCQLVWDLWPVGVVSYQNTAPLTWGDLLGFGGDIWTNSSGFLSAMHKLEMMGEHQATGISGPLGGLQLSWTGVFPGSEVSGFHEGSKVEDLQSVFSHQLRELMGFHVHRIARICAKQSGKLVLNTSKRPRLEESVSAVGDAPTTELCQSLAAKNVDLTEPSDLTEMTIMLASTPAEMFSLSFANRLVDEENDNGSDSQTVVVNGGLLLNVLLRGRVLCHRAGHTRSYQTASGSVRKCELTCSWQSDWVFAAICSAVAELPSETVMETLDFFAVRRGRWLWLVFMLCCGSPMLNLLHLKIIGASLLRADVVAIHMMMKNRYPVVESKTSTVRAPEYGYASIPEGAELQPTNVAGGDNEVLIAGSAFRGRARYDPTSAPDWVDVVVPGYGIRKARIGEEACRFDRDSLKIDTQAFRECRLQSLKLHIGDIMLDTSVLDLLRYVGAGLRTLSMELDESLTDQYYDPSRRADLDLGELAAVCPRLEVLELEFFDVVILPGANDDALRDWPIKKVIATHSDRLPDLAPYLENPGMRMARELVEIRATGPDNDEDARKKLEVHDGDYLPVVKEPFPVQSKIAMLSVVANSVLGVKAIKKLDANILRHIFAFAATPERRTVNIRGW